MSSSEERVVVLTFDNSNFEKNTQKSLETLNNLDASIEKAGAANGLTKLSAAANKIDLSGLANNVQSVSDRFSNMGVVGMTVIQNLTNSVVDLGKKAFHQMVSGGWTRAANIEKAKFQIEGLKGVWDETSKGYVEGMKTIKEAVNNAVDSTAYGLDEAAVIGSQLMASGITDANQLEEHLKSVSGLAAMTGGSYADIGRVYAQVAGQGRLMGNQLLQISQRGINAAATMKDYANSHIEVRDALLAAAKASGKNTNMVNNMIDQISKGAELTEADIRDLVSTGVVSFEFFSAAMGEAFAEHAKDANKTFDGALANMKAALNRIGAEFATPLRNNLRDIFNALTPVINNIKAALMPFINIVVAAGKKVTAGIVAVLNVIAKATAPVEAAAKTVKKATKQVDKAGKTVKKLSGIMTISKREAKAAFDIWNKGTYGNGLARRKALEKEGMSYKHVQGYVNALVKYNFDLDKVHKKIRVSGDKVSKTLEKSTKNTKAATKHTKEYWHHLKILNENEKWRTVVQHKGVETAWKLYQQNQKRIKQEKEEAHRLSIIQAIIVGVKAAISAIKNVALAVWNVIKTIGVSLKAIFGPIIDTLFNLTGSGGGLLLLGIINLTQKLKELTETGLSKVSSVMDSKVRPAMEKFSIKLRDGIINVIRFLATNKTLHKVLDSIWTIIKKIGTAIGKFVASIKDYFKNTKQGKENAKVLKDIWEVIKKLAAGALHQVVTDLERLSKVKISLPDFGDIVGKFSGKGKSGGALSSMLDMFNKLKSNGLKKTLADLFAPDAAYATTGGNVTETIKGFAANLGESGDVIIDATNSLDHASKTADKSLGFIEKTGNKLTDAMTSFDWERILAGGWEVGKIYAIIQGTRAAFKLANSLGGVFTAISNAIAPYAGIMGVIKKNLGYTMKIKMVKDVAISIGILAAAMYVLSKIKGDDALKAVGLMASCIGMLVATVLVLANKVALSTPTIIAMGAAFLLISTSMLILAGAIKIFSSFDPKNLAKGIGVITILIGVFTLASRLSGRIMGGTVSVLGMALAIDALIPAVIIFSKLKPETVAKGGLAIMFLMTELAIASRIAKKSVKNAAAMVAMAIAVDLLVPAVIIMSLIPFGKALKGAMIIGALIMSVAAAAKFAGNAKLSSLLSMTAAITVLCGTVVILAFLPIKKAITAGAAVSSVFVTLAIAIAMASKIGSAESLLTIVGVVSVIALTFGLLAQLPIEQVLAIGGSLSAALLSIAIAVGILAPLNVVGAAAAVAGLAIFVTGLVGVLSLLGAMFQSEEVRLLVHDGSRMFGMLGQAIGNFVGSIVSGFGQAVAAGLPKIGEDLSQFMENLKPFLKTAKSLDSDVGSTIKNLAAAILMLTGSSFLDSINIFSGGNEFEKFGEQLIKFIKPLQKFADESANIDDDSLKAVKKVAKIIRTLALAAQEIPNTGMSFARVFVGQNDLDTFAEYIAKAAPKIKDAADELALIDNWKGLKKIGPIVNTMAKAAQEIPNTHAYGIKWFVGENDLDTFAEYIADAAPNIKDAAAALQDFSGAGNLEKVAPIIKSFAKASQEIPNTHAWGIKWFVGENDLDTFAEYIADAAPNIKDAANALTDIYDGGIERLEKIAPILKALATAADEIPNFSSFETPENNKLKDFADYLCSAMPSVAAAANALTDADPTGIDNVLKFIKSLSKLSEAADVDFDPTKFNGLLQVLGGVEIFGQKFGLGPAIANFCSSLEGVDTSKLTPVGGFIKTLAELASESAEIDPLGFKDLISVIGDNTESGLGPAVANFCTALNGISTDKLSNIGSFIDTIVDAANKSSGVSFVGLEDLANTLPLLAKKLSSFSSKLKNFKGEAAKSAAGVVKELMSVVDTFQQFTTVGRRGSSTSSSFDDKGFNTFIDSLGKLASKIKSFAEEMKGVKTGSLKQKAENIKTFLSTVVTSISEANKTLKKKGKIGLQKFINGFTNTSKLGTDVSSIGGKILTAMGSPGYKTFKSGGTAAMKKFVEGLKQRDVLADAKGAGEKVYKQAKDGADGSLYTVGVNVGQGFANGMRDRDPTSAAYSAGAHLYELAKQAIRDKGGVESPAKDMMPIGRYVSEGFVIGMLSYRKNVYKSGEEIADMAMTGVSDNISSDFTDPVIKPVLDLSDIKSGVNSIGGMFGTTSIKPSLVPTMQNRQNGAENEDLIEAINNMSSNIVKQTNNSGQTYNIGDVTLEVSDLKDVVTLEQLVSVIKKAKSFS